MSAASLQRAATVETIAVEHAVLGVAVTPLAVPFATTACRYSVLQRTVTVFVLSSLIQ